METRGKCYNSHGFVWIKKSFCSVQMKPSTSHTMHMIHSWKKIWHHKAIPECSLFSFIFIHCTIACLDWFKKVRGHRLLLFRVFSESFFPSSIVLGAASPGHASSDGEDYKATIIEPECSLLDHRSGLPSCCTFQDGGPPVTRMFSERRITLLYVGPSLFCPLPLHLLGLTTHVAHHPAALWTCSWDFLASD